MTKILKTLSHIVGDTHDMTADVCLTTLYMFTFAKDNALIYLAIDMREILEFFLSAMKVVHYESYRLINVHSKFEADDEVTNDEYYGC